MSDHEVAARYAFAQETARSAGRLALDYYRRREDLAVDHKGVQDRATVADRAVEEYIRDTIATHFAEDGFLGEESSERRFAADTDGGQWVVDPIDGTDCFIFGMPSWCVSIAWVLGGEVRIGVVYDPVHDDMYAGRQGGGAFLNGRPMAISTAASLAAGLVGIGHSNRVPPAPALAAIDRLLEADGMFHRCGSGALSLAWVASGRLIGYYEPHMNAWDCLAGLLLVREAGGWTNDFLAGDGLNSGNMMIAAAPGVIDHIRHIGGLSRNPA